MRLFGRFLGFMFAAGSLVFVVGAAAAAYIIWQFGRDLPDYSALQNYQPPVMTRVHANDGSLIGEYARERRLHVPIQAVPRMVINAFISAEDKNFWTHPGVDHEGLARAVWNNIRFFGQRRPEGASTITQQVAKNFLLSNDTTIERKIKEALVALRMEQVYSKEKILELYLNEIFLGQINSIQAYGLAAAALLYFDKSVHELTLSEAAYLAALPKGPNNYHPFRFPQIATARRNYVIERMFEDGHITRQQADEARRQPLGVVEQRAQRRPFASEYFAEEVRRQLNEQFGEKVLYEGGLSVRTTLDPRMQVMLRRALVDQLVRFDQVLGWRGPASRLNLAQGEWGRQLAGVTALADVAPWRIAVVLTAQGNAATIGFQPTRLRGGEVAPARETGQLPVEQMRWARPADGPRRGAAVRTVADVLQPGDVIYVEPVGNQTGTFALRQIPEVAGGAVAMDPYTGRVLAMVGGFSFSESVFNRATQAFRQPGSSFKPLIYAAALDNGYTPASVVMDAPFEIDQGGGLGIWRPENYSGQFYGPSTLRVGIERSRNVMTVRLAQDMGMPLIAEYARRFGIYDDMPQVLSMSLGAGETTVMRMTTAYSMFANGGRKIRATLIDRIQDRNGRTVFRHDERQCQDCTVAQWRNQPPPDLVDRREQVIDTHTAYQITSMMEGVIQRGTAVVIREVGKPLAGKTGTTNDERDAWFVGYAPNLAMGVYIGYDRPRPMGARGSGSGLAAPVFRDFMRMALADQPATPFRVPEGTRLIRIDARTGLRASGAGGNTILEAFRPGQSPPDTLQIIGFTDQMGRPTTVAPAVDRQIGSGTGGLY